MAMAMTMAGSSAFSIGMAHNDPQFFSWLVRNLPIGYSFQLFFLSPSLSVSASFGRTAKWKATNHWPLAPVHHFAQLRLQGRCNMPPVVCRATCAPHCRVACIFHLAKSKSRALPLSPSLCVAFTLHMHYLPWPSSSSKLNSLTPCKVFVPHTSCKLQLTKKTLPTAAFAVSM